ncbi:ATP-binding protein [Xylanibacter muris]|uniref:ATP-binding protein n=1 Tax=Xylanibacter muris TaxID=2736290 RepID=A0ABX2AJN3_9BACT|nr:ATP-binding protein [Xylanibacter muris]NPD91366.1 ATP-binding protein [Xylanibacter muris]
MDKRFLEIILSDQAEELSIKRALHFCQRKEEDKIDLDSTQAQVIIGVRRSGKSTLCYNALVRKGVKFAYVNFDDERLIEISGKDLNDVLEVLYKINGDFKYLFIDEIQNIPEWYLFVNRLLRKQIHVIITGSNAKLLSGELATHLTGRHHSISLYPFSFEEFCKLKSIDTRSMTTKAIANRRAAFDIYIQQGGFPELQSINDDRDYIEGLVDNILKRDIEQRFRIMHTASFEQMSQHLLNVAPTIIVDKSLQESFGLKSQHTAKNYVNYLKQAYLLVGLNKYSQKSRQRLTEEKVYPIDVALMNKRPNAFAKENLGWRLETIVYMELIRRYKNKGLDIYYYSDRSGECDFIVCNATKALLAIQVSYDISAEKTRKREISGLILAAKKTGCEKLLLLTDHQHESIIQDGHDIQIRPVYEYVLQDTADI